MLCSTPQLSSCSVGLIMKTELLCQRYRTHAIRFTFLPFSRKQHTPAGAATGNDYQSLRQEEGSQRQRQGKRTQGDNPKNWLDTCGWLYCNCFPKRSFVLDRHILFVSKRAVFPHSDSEWRLSTNRPLGVSHSTRHRETEYRHCKCKNSCHFTVAFDQCVEIGAPAPFWFNRIMLLRRYAQTSSLTCAEKGVMGNQELQRPTAGPA